MSKTIDYFWSLSGTAIKHPEVQKVAELPGQTRLQVLIDLLDGIAQKVYESIGRSSPRDKLSQTMADTFMHDLFRPTVTEDVRALAQKQLAHYIQSKPFAGKESSKGAYFCPICNSPFESRDGIKHFIVTRR